MDLSPPNPYQPPAAHLDVPAPPSVVGSDASRGSRLAAALIDAVLSAIVIGPLQYWAGVYDGLPSLKEGSLPWSALWPLLTVLVWIATHGYFLAKSAQTVGKKLIGIQVVNISDGRPAPLGRLVALRFLPTILIGMIPRVGNILTVINVLFIFRSDRRCIHDHIARTRVVVMPRQEGS